MQPRGRAAVFRQLLPTVALGSLLVVLLASPASAHAALLASTLRDGDRFAVAPNEVTLTFSETVVLPRGAVNLYDATATVTPDVSVQAVGTDVRVTLPRLDQGAYVLTVRVISADGHVIYQSFRFVVGDQVSVDEQTLDRAVLAAKRDPTRPVMVALRALTYIGMLLALGVALLHRWLLDGGLLQGHAKRFAAKFAYGGAAAAVLSAAVTAWWLYAPRSVPALVGALTDTATSGFLFRAVALGLLGVVCTWHRLRVGIGGAAILVVASQVLDGHQLTFGVRWVMVIADTVHVFAGGVWFGGAVLLWWLWRRDARALRGAARRFTQGAFWVAVVTVASGVAMAQQLLDSPVALIATRYGNVLLVKLLAVGAVGVLAFRLKQVLMSDAAGPAQLRRRFRSDIGAFVAVVSLTAVMVTTNPQADISQALITERTTLGPYTLDLAIEPGRAGLNVLHAYVITANGTLATTSDTLTLSATYVAADGERIGPFPTELAWVSDGHFLAVTDVFGFAGSWELTFGIPIDRFSVATQTLVVTLD